MPTRQLQVCNLMGRSLLGIEVKFNKKNCYIICMYDLDIVVTTIVDILIITGKNLSHCFLTIYKLIK
jgi:hypothetical protein